ncbi:hypothetical protein [Mycolicibacterium mucogenicum]|uniref:Uncharacterized protein n=1 Tax=Mycolicibacterium mucogenicum DSM 44124 TaxID=1226753 RepID=A0A8E4W129_MYCMU|nr:hypothetical protein [Mycolicibacterium mucogenicum]QPG67703.1 hypothetical protein C1S78_019455 [Mycolicibacterium mucogenicum DSM 44124]
MKPMKPRWRPRVFSYQRVLAIVSIVTLLLAALITTTRHDHESAIAALPGATAQPSIPGGGGSGGSGGNGGGPPFPMQPPAMPDAPGSYNGGSYPAPFQGNGIDIHNPAEQPAQAPQQQPNFQQTNPQQLQPANGQQPPDYDSPLQTAQARPQQQQPNQQQQTQQQEQQQNQQDQESERENQCSDRAAALSERELTPAERAAYRALRSETPGKSDLKGHVAKRDGLDPNDARWSPDHIVALRRLVQIPGFIDLPFADQLAIADSDENTYALAKDMNRSKGQKLPEEWGGKVLNSGNEMTPEEFAEFCRKQGVAIEHVFKETAKRLALSSSKSAPDGSSVRAPERPESPAQAPKAPSKADSVPRYPIAPSTEEILQHQFDAQYLLGQQRALNSEFWSLEHAITYLNTDSAGNLTGNVPTSDAALASQLHTLQTQVAHSLNLIDSLVKPSPPVAPPPAPAPAQPAHSSVLGQFWNWLQAGPVPIIPPVLPIPIPVPVP